MKLLVPLMIAAMIAGGVFHEEISEFAVAMTEEVSGYAASSSESAGNAGGVALGVKGMSDLGKSSSNAIGRIGGAIGR